MATYTVPAGTATASATLTIGTADTVTFADRYNYVSVTNLGTTMMYVRADGTASVTGAQGAYVVAPGASAVVANGLPNWYPSSRVLRQGTLHYGNGNTTDSPTSPGRVNMMESLAGQAVNPGTSISVISAGADAYTIAAAG